MGFFTELIHQCISMERYRLISTAMGDEKELFSSLNPIDVIEELSTLRFILQATGQPAELDMALKNYILPFLMIIVLFKTV